MALKAGDVYVNVTANIGELTKGLKRVVDDVARTAKKIESFGNKLGEIGVIASAAMAGTLLAASQWSAGVSDAVERIKNIFMTFAATIGDALLPFLKQMGDVLQRLLGVFQAMGPGTQKLVASALAYGAAISVAGGAVGKTAGLVGSLAETFSSLGIPAMKAMSRWSVGLAAAMTSTQVATAAATSGLGSLPAAAAAAEGAVAVAGGGMAAAFGAILAPLAAVAAAVAGVVLLAGTLFHVWKDNSDAIKAALGRAWEAVRGFVGRIAQTWVDGFGQMIDFFKAIVVTVLDGFALIVRSHAQMMQRVARTLHLDGLAKMLEPLTTLTGAKMADGIFAGVKAAGEKVKSAAAGVASTLAGVGASVGEGIAYGASYAWEGVVAGGKAALAGLKSLLPGGGAAMGTIRGAPSFASAGQVGLPRPFESLAGFAPKDSEQFTGIARNFTALEKMIRSNLEQIRQVGQAVADDFAEGFVNMANGVEGAFKSMVTSILADLERLAAHKAFEALLNIGMNALSGLGGIDSTGQNGVIGGSDVLSAMPTLRTAGAGAVHAPMSFSISISTDGTATTSSQGGTEQMQRMAKGIQAAVKRHLQEEMRPGGDLYNFARAR